MASVEHCLYCFEVLAAELQGRQPMSLYQVINSWQEYPKGLDSDSDSDSPDHTDTTIPQPLPAQKPSAPSQQTRPSLTSRLSSSRHTTRSNTNLAPPSRDSNALLPPDRPFTPVGIGRKTSQRSTTITESPLFVTWNKASPHSSYNLRGCIGTFEPLPLSSGLSSYALTSALSDTRFNPITASELPRLQVAVTLLTDFEPCADAMDWELGVHGLRISFYYRSRRLGATYLPDVAVEQGWDKEETLISLMRKAGWNGREERWKECGDLKVVRYQGKKESVEWEEYKAWRDWVDKGSAK